MCSTWHFDSVNTYLKCKYRPLDASLDQWEEIIGGYEQMRDPKILYVILVWFTVKGEECQTFCFQSKINKLKFNSSLKNSLESP